MVAVPLRASVIPTPVTSAVTFTQVLRGTPPNRFTTAEKVKISKVKLTKRGGVITKAVADTFTPGSTQRYDTQIEFMTGKNVRLSCSCDDFVYRFEWVLFNKGGADIRYGDGTAPDKTNPARTLGCCKHLIALRNYLVDQSLIEPK